MPWYASFSPYPWFAAFGPAFVRGPTLTPSSPSLPASVKRNVPATVQNVVNLQNAAFASGAAFNNFHAGT
jgi:hypothetical protein